jgi:hypothetical protein
VLLCIYRNITRNNLSVIISVMLPTYNRNETAILPK